MEVKIRRKGQKAQTEISPKGGALKEGKISMEVKESKNRGKAVSLAKRN